MKVINHCLYTVAIFATLMVGCSSDNGASSALGADFNIQTTLEEENSQALKFIQNSERLDSSMSQVLALTYSIGLELEELQQLSPMELSRYLSDSEIEEINTLTQSKMLIEIENILDAVEQLKSLEHQIGLYNNTYEQRALVELALGTIAVLPFIEIGIACSDQLYGNYSSCYNKKKEEPTTIHDPETGKLISTLSTKCEDFPLCSGAAKASCAMEAAMKVDDCKKSAVLTFINKFRDDAVMYLIPQTTVPVVIKGTIESGKNSLNGMSSIVGQWKENCDSDGKSLSRNDSRMNEKEYIYLTQSSDGNLELPEGSWDITAFSEGMIRQSFDCIEVDENNPPVLELSSIDELVVSNEPPTIPSEPGTSTIPEGFVATINIGSEQKVFRPENLAFLIEDGYPGVLAVTLYDENPNDADNSKEDTETLIILKFLPSLLPGKTYAATAVNDPNIKFSIGYTSKFTNKTIMATSGSISITSFGNEYGDRISGSFDCDMSEITLTKAGGIKTSSAGHIKGTFNGVLHLHSYYD